MRYHYTKPDNFIVIHGQVYLCENLIFDRCTLYKAGPRGLAVIQQRYSPSTKHTWWTEIDPWLIEDIYNQKGFSKYFNKMAAEPVRDIYPTVTVRQIMWALKMKPLKREPWETCFDHAPILHTPLWKHKPTIITGG